MAARKSHLEWARTFTELLKTHFGSQLVSVILYGSVSRGKEREDSDIDLLIVLDGIKEGRYRRRSMLDPLYEEWDRSWHGQKVPQISTLLKTPVEAEQLSPIYFDMIDRREILFDRDHFMETVLKKTEARLAKLGARRRHLGKIEYWDLKPDYRPGEVFEI